MTDIWENHACLKANESLAIEERDNGVFIVALNRPSKRNALDVEID